MGLAVEPVGDEAVQAFMSSQVECMECTPFSGHVVKLRRLNENHGGAVHIKASSFSRKSGYRQNTYRSWTPGHHIS